MKFRALLLAGSVICAAVPATRIAHAVTGAGSDSDRRQACKKAQADAAAQVPGKRVKYGECRCSKNSRNQVFDCTITAD